MEMIKDIYMGNNVPIEKAQIVSKATGNFISNGLVFMKSFLGC